MLFKQGSLYSSSHHSSFRIILDERQRTAYNATFLVLCTLLTLCLLVPTMYFCLIPVCKLWTRAISNKTCGYPSYVSWNDRSSPLMEGNELFVLGDRQLTLIDGLQLLLNRIDHEMWGRRGVRICQCFVNEHRDHPWSYGFMAQIMEARWRFPKLVPANNQLSRSLAVTQP